MGLTSAMLVGFTGIKSSQSLVDAIDDNIANVNTTAFKSQRALLETQQYETIDPGSGPSEVTGGRNPLQIGFGSALASVQRNFDQGSIQATGVPTDLAVEGNGFFVVAAPTGEQLYTRDGSFALDARNTLVTPDGAKVQGFAADADGTIAVGTLGDVVVPVGVAAEAVPTSSVLMGGGLDAAADVAATGAIVQSNPLMTTGGPAAAGTALTDLVDSDGAALFTDGDVISVSGMQKGGLQLPDAEFTVGQSGSTLGDFAAFLQTAAGINTDPATGGTPGVTIADGDDPPPGTLLISSNLGEANAISLDGSTIRNATTGVLPFTFTATPATGDGVTTGFTVFDSLGNPVEVRLRFAMESRDSSGTVWRFYAESADAGDGNPAVGSGTLSFDQNGRLVGSTGTSLSINRDGTGAATPLTFELDFAGVNGLASPEGGSAVAMTDQDGHPAGTLVGYGIDADGVITGTFSSGATQVFGQVAVATFTNPAGLIANAANTFASGPNSGSPVVVAPRTSGAGSIRAGSLEGSNVEVSREFIGLITASAGFSAASRVVRTADDLLQELLLLTR